MGRVYTMGSVRVEVSDESQFLCTVFPDGTVVPAAPNHDPESVARAHSLGYGGDTWMMSRDHELVHTWLAQQDGLEWSPVLWGVAHSDLPSRADVLAEESRVLAFQAGLDKALGAHRPWD